MCIIAYKPADKTIDRATLERCWDRNKDGAGFMYNVNGHLKVKKGFFNFDKFYESYRQSTEGKKAVIHFRITTHGNTNAENCHPFIVNEHLAFAHNGVINSISTDSDRTFSDTWHFNEKILKPLSGEITNIFGSNATCELIRGYIGASKLVFLTDKDDVFIVNERMGEWNEGCWFSNSSYKEWKPQQPTHQVSRSTSVVPYKPMESPAANADFYKKKKDLLKTGAIVQFNTRHSGTSKGAVGTIESVNSNYTVNIEMYTYYGTTYIKNNVPIAIIDVIDHDDSDIINYLDMEYYGGV